MLSWTIEKPREELRLLDFLCQKIPLAPASYIRKLIRSGKAQINGIPAEPDQRLQDGDTVSISESQRVTDLLEQKEKQPTVLLESNEILIVQKPANLATHSGKGHETDNLTARVIAMLHDQGRKFKIAPIHRLDLQTSGPVIFGKGKKAISELGKLMQENLTRKKYLALTSVGLPQAGTLAGSIPSKGKTKHAETSYRNIGHQGALALLELQLQTGRQHQIRKQLADSGHPVAGDNRYRGLQLPGLDRLFLHCHELGFNDPFSGQAIIVHDPLPETLNKVLEKNGFFYSHKPEEPHKSPITA